MDRMVLQSWPPLLLIGCEELRKREINLNVMDPMGKEYTWLTVGVRLLANRCSFMFLWQHPCQVWGIFFLKGYNTVSRRSIAAVPLHRDWHHVCVHCVVGLILQDNRVWDGPAMPVASYWGCYSQMQSPSLELCLLRTLFIWRFGDSSSRNFPQLMATRIGCVGAELAF